MASAVTPRSCLTAAGRRRSCCAATPAACGRARVCRTGTATPVRCCATRASGTAELARLQLTARPARTRSLRRPTSVLGVPAAEEHDVRQQRVELVQPDTVPPTLAQRPLPLVALDNGVEIRAAEQRQHRQVGLAMAAVRRGVDQHRAAGGPHDVAAPQIAVQPGRRIVVVEITCVTAPYHGVDGVARRRIQSRPARSAIGARRSLA